MSSSRPEPYLPVIVTRHAPEHGTAGAPDLLPAGCCCCCCCLHSIGALAGAMYGSAKQIDSQPVQNTDPNAPFPYRLDVHEEDLVLISPVLLYWVVLALLVLAAAFAAPPLIEGFQILEDPAEYATIAGSVTVLFLPGLNLLAALVCVVVIAVFYPERGYSIRRIGRIALWSFVGAVCGGMLLVGGCVVVSGARF